MMPVIWVESQQLIPKIGTATDWHDGQFSHEVHAQFSLGMSGKSVPRRFVTPNRPCMAALPCVLRRDDRFSLFAVRKQGRDNNERAFALSRRRSRH
jgi:hypothetical protein